MWRTLVDTTRQLYQRTRRVFVADRPTPIKPQTPTAPAPDNGDLPLSRVVLTEGVSKTLLDDFAAHRATARGQEETGWVLLGRREGDAVLVLATLPAGADRDAGVAHVRFNPMAQAVGSRIVRQKDKRLDVVGIVHTHPGNMRQPSAGDWHGDSEWVKQLRGHEGVFAIGTAEGQSSNGTSNGAVHEDDASGLYFTWYALKHGDAEYRPLDLDVSAGLDLARPLHPVWDAVETHAEQIDRLYRQQKDLHCEAVPTAQGPTLLIQVRLAESNAGLKVLIRGRQVRYFLVRGSDVLASDLDEPRVDVGVYQMLVELAKQAG